MAARFALIVDNPLRDLDGLVLLADRLARRGHRVFLVPMYAQGFDIPALRPDVVATNYVRSNNVDLLRLYRRSGVRIAVLDTEGAAGKDADDYARFVARQPVGELVDLYCLWGEAQREALRRTGAMPPERLRVTGCPRFDYCAEPWRRALLPVAVEGDYILVNTNFPVVNPRFSSGPDREKRAMRDVGFSPDFAERFARDGRRALESVRAAVDRLAARFPGETFVLRPHPFENMETYASLRSRPNVRLRQEGTSLQWIRSAKMLIHQNCSTAVEAVMMGREPLSLEWFNTDALCVPGPQSVSRPADSLETLERLVDALLRGKAPALSEEQVAARRDRVWSLYGPSDGRSSERVADALGDLAAAPPGAAGRRPSLRGRAVHAFRRAAGHRWAERWRGFFSSAGRESARKAKAFDVTAVRDTLRRLSIAAGTPTGDLRAEPVVPKDRRLSGQTILVEAAGA